MDSGNEWRTAMAICTLAVSGALGCQYRRVSGNGSISIAEIKVAMIKVA